MSCIKKIIRNYYLLGVNDKAHLSVSLKLKSGDYIGRVSNVGAYALVDSLLFIKNSDQKDYYVLATAKDFDYAKIEDVVTGPLDSATFTLQWLNGRHLKFISEAD